VKYKVVDEENSTTVGSIETLELPPNAVLIVSVPPSTLDSDLEQIRAGLKAFFNQTGINQPIGIIRAGDLKFVRLVPVETAHAND